MNNNINGDERILAERRKIQSRAGKNKQKIG